MILSEQPEGFHWHSSVCQTVGGGSDRTQVSSWFELDSSDGLVGLACVNAHLRSGLELRHLILFPLLVTITSSNCKRWISILKAPSSPLNTSRGELPLPPHNDPVTPQGKAALVDGALRLRPSLVFDPAGMKF